MQHIPLAVHCSEKKNKSTKLNKSWLVGILQDASLIGCCGPAQKVPAVNSE